MTKGFSNALWAQKAWPRRAVCTLAVTALLAACGGGTGGGLGEVGSALAADGSSDPTASTDPTTTGNSTKAAAPTSGLAANSGQFPVGASGVAMVRTSSTTEQPGASDGTGNFRTVCDYSHMAYDDPIVYPRQPGRSHLHAFFGNSGTDANSNAASIAQGGNSTCRGGTLNRSAYWVPAMIDTRTRTPVKPLESMFYYKTGYNGVSPASVKPFPAGLRMIAGDPTNRVASGHFRYYCFNNPGMKGSTFPNCAVGDELVTEIWFPQCWDGVNLDSPDHKSHMAYPRGGCPATHPVALPEITFNIHYPITQANQTANWRLSSDTYDGPPGYSSHGDWWNGWEQSAMEGWVRNCANAAVDCHAHLLGNGLQIF